MDGLTLGILARAFLEKAGVASGFAVILIGFFVFIVRQYFTYREKRATEAARAKEQKDAFARAEKARRTEELKEEREENLNFLRDLMERSEKRETKLLEYISKMTATLEVIKTDLSTDQKLALDRHSEVREQFEKMDKQHDDLTRDIWKSVGRRPSG